MTETNAFYSIKEFALKLGVHPNTIRRAIKCKKINAIRFCGVYRIPYNEISRMVEFDLEEYIENEVKKRVEAKGK